jgi:hypothetical protein
MIVDRTATYCSWKGLKGHAGPAHRGGPTSYLATDVGGGSAVVGHYHLGTVEQGDPATDLLPAHRHGHLPHRSKINGGPEDNEYNRERNDIIKDDHTQRQERELSRTGCDWSMVTSAHCSLDKHQPPNVFEGHGQIRKYARPSKNHPRPPSEKCPRPPSKKCE